MAIVALLAAACASLIANAALLYLLHRFAVIDVPNARSLHAQPTPRGGGIAIALVFSVGVAFLSTTGAWHWPWLLIGAGFAALGGWDDWRPRRTAVRLGAQIALSAVFLVLTWPGTLTLLSALQFTLIALAFVWMVNLFNFMDGADGFAAAQTILFALGAAWIFAHHGHAELAYALLTLAAVTAGFLPYNWHPARMFMGDVGSYFLGFQFAAFLYAGWRFEASPAALLA